MNAGQFYKYMDFPDRLGIHEEVQLRGMLKEYPYFQTAHLLLAKCLKNMDNYTFEKQLRLAAIYAPNRAVMYKLLKTVKESNVTEPLVEPEQGVIQETNVQDGEKPMPEPIRIYTPPVQFSADEADDIVIHDIHVSETDSDSSNTKPVESAVINDIPSQSSVLSGIDVKETDPLENRRQEIAARYQEFLRKKEEKKAGNQSSDATIQPEPTTIHNINNLESVTTATEREEKTFLVKEKPEIPAEVSPPIDFTEPENTEILKRVETESLKTDVPVEHKPAVDQNIPERLNTDSGKTMSFTDWLKNADYSATPLPLTGTSTDTSIKAHHNVDDILERFIQTNPSITKPKAEFFNPQKAAQKSLELDDNMVTETLARLYEKQGNFQKALDMYQKLCLKFPLRETIFAARIAKLREELNKE